jgi:NAD dependent epimerase/dehydratase family enzyme
VRRTSQGVLDAASKKPKVLIKDDAIGAFVEKLNQKVEESDGKQLAFDKWSDFHLNDIGKYTLE